MIQDDDWWIEALCAQVGTELFFPDKGEGNSTARDAKRICMRCSVRVPCLNWALSHADTHGIWGGLSEKERRQPALVRRQMLS